MILPANITGITSDSRLVEKGNMFVAIAGAKFDGRTFINAAIEKAQSPLSPQRERISKPYQASPISR